MVLPGVKWQKVFQIVLYNLHNFLVQKPDSESRDPIIMIAVNAMIPIDKLRNALTTWIC